MKLRSNALALAFLSVCGCTMATIGGVDGSAPDATGAATCSGTIGEVQAYVPFAMLWHSCPSRWEDVVPPQACPGSLAAGPCGGALIYAGYCSLDHFVCVYDNTSHVLVGVVESTDNNAYCNHTSSCIAAGVFPPQVSCTSTGSSVASTCNLPVLGDASDGGDVIAQGPDSGVPPTGTFACGPIMCPRSSLCATDSNDAGVPYRCVSLYLLSLPYSCDQVYRLTCIHCTQSPDGDLSAVCPTN